MSTTINIQDTGADSSAPGPDLTRDDAERSYVHLDTLGQWSNHIVKRAVEESIIAAEDRRIKAQTAMAVAEDLRADRRNRNRMMMLLVVLLMTFVVPWFVSTIINSPGLLKYSTAIAIVPDTLLTMYAAWRKY